ncbi:MAG: hypothetical protein ACP5JJ_15680 [Anaerolineae bacterium]
MKRTTGILAAAIFLLLMGSVLSLAMSSTHFRLDWFTPGTSGGGGGPVTSGHYAANLTIGQSAVGTLSSAHYQACLGYWCGVPVPNWIYLPLVMRNESTQ